MTRTELLDQAKGYILANAQVVENIRLGKQTQHRVPMRVQPTAIVPSQTVPTTWRAIITEGTLTTAMDVRPPWEVGQLLWLREPGRVVGVCEEEDCFAEWVKVKYHDGSIELISTPSRVYEKWDSYDFGAPDWVVKRQGIPNGIFREAARIFLRVKRVWPEQIQKTSVEDMIAEGLTSYFREHDACCDLRDKYHALMNSLYPGIVEANKWLWCCEFEKVEAKP